MHVLIISSDELYADYTMPSIFELAQAKAIQRKKVKVTMLVVNMPYTVLGLVKNLFYAMVSEKKRSSFKYNKCFSLLLKDLIKAISIKVGFNKNETEKLTIEGIDVYVTLLIPFYSITKTEKLLSTWKNKALDGFSYYLIQEGKPDLIHAHSRFLFGGYLAMMIKKKYKINYVLTEHSSYYANMPLSENIIRYAKEMIMESSVFICVSHSLAKDIQKRLSFPEKEYNYTVIPNLFDLEFEKKRENIFPDDDEFVFVNVASSLIDIKGQIYLLRAFNEAFRGNKKIKLKIIGEGRLGKFLRKYVQDENLEDQIYFLGHLDQDTLIVELDKSNVFVLSSTYETFGVVVIEAISRGLPVVSTSCGGPEGFINDSNGFLVERCDASSLAEGLIKIYNRYDFYNRDLIKQNAISEFGNEAVADKLIEIYENSFQNKSV